MSRAYGIPPPLLETVNSSKRSPEWTDSHMQLRILTKDSTCALGEYRWDDHYGHIQYGQTFNGKVPIMIKKGVVRSNPMIPSLFPVFMSGLYFRKNKVLQAKPNKKIGEKRDLCETLLSQGKNGHVRIRVEGDDLLEIVLGDKRIDEARSYGLDVAMALRLTGDHFNSAEVSTDSVGMSNH